MNPLPLLNSFGVTRLRTSIFLGEGATLELLLVEGGVEVPRRMRTSGRPIADVELRGYPANSQNEVTGQ